MKKIPYNKVRKIEASEVGKLKINCPIYRDGRVFSASISVVLPTFNKKSKTYNKVLANMVRNIGELIDKGVVDELLIVDSSSKKGKPDPDFMAFLLAVCKKSCKTFSKEVDFLKSVPEGKQKAVQGRFDFSVKFVSQLDPRLQNLLLMHGIFNKEKIDEIKKGMGAALWLSVPMTHGKIMCFLDSDIKSFDESYVLGLCKPLLDTWFCDKKTSEIKPGILWTKASYVRRKTGEKGKYRLGGRVTRLVAGPIIRILSKNGAFKDMEKLKYPLSSEFAFTKDELKGIKFSNGHDIETSMLCQAWKNFGTKSIAEVDLGVYSHISDTEDYARAKAREVVMGLLYWARRYGMLEKVNLDDLHKEYEKTAKGLLNEYKNAAEKTPNFEYTETDRKTDIERIKDYSGIIAMVADELEKHEPELLPSWDDVAKLVDKEEGYSYHTMKNALRDLINDFTTAVVFSQIYIDRSGKIMESYTK